MAEIRDIAGFTSRNSINDWWWIVEGSGGTDYELKSPSSDEVFMCLPHGGIPVPDLVPAYFLEHDGDHFPSFDGTTNANGAYVLTGFEVTGGHEYELYVYRRGGLAKGNDYNGTCLTEGSLDNRNDGGSPDPFTYDINGSTAQDTPYIDAGTLVATPGDGQVLLEWDAATTAIVEDGDLVYSLWRNGVASGTLIQQDGSTSFLDTGLTNGVAYRYRVVCEFRLDLVPERLVGADVYARHMTNEVTATPFGTFAVSLDSIHYAE